MQTFRDPRATSPNGQLPTVLPKNQARQGVTGHNVRYVLAVSLTAAVIALALVYAFFFVLR